MLDDIKLRIKSNLNKEVKVVVLGMRNHKEVFEGKIISALANVFVISSRGLNKTFSYSDVLIGDVILTYL